VKTNFNPTTLVTPLTLVLCKKAAFEIRPYDSAQTGLLGAGAGALLGGAAAGLGSYALGAKSKKRTSDSLKAALIGALGGGALGGYAGYSYGDDNLKKTWDSVYKPRFNGDEFGNLGDVQQQSGGLRDLYLVARKKLEGTRDMSVEQYEKLQDDTPGRRLGFVPWTVQDPDEDTVARGSDALRERIQGSMRKNISVPPGEFLSRLWKDEDHPASSPELEQDIAPEMNWLKGEGAPTKPLVEQLVKQYQR
jgi:hypothetical protein